MNYIDYCSCLYASLRIPASCYEQGKLLYSSFTARTGLALIPFSDTHRFFLNPDVYEAASDVLYGKVMVEGEDACIILGPVYNVPASDSAVREFMREHAISSQYREAVCEFLQDIPPTPFTQFVNHLAFVHLTLNHRALDISEHFQMHDHLRTREVADRHMLEIYDSKENLTLHNTYYKEQAMYHIVQEGNAEKLKSFLASDASPRQEGTVASQPLRQAKNIFIGGITKLVVLAAIPGGMDVEEAYFLADVYIQRCEQLQSIKEVYDLHYGMMLDYCERIRRSQIPLDIPSELHICITYIRDHTNEPIRIADVARQIDKSESYVVKKFKEELGINVGAFIMRCKLEEARSLLTYSGKSLSEISSYLCFSSQSYFQNVFKKHYGVTPAAYRKGSVK